MSASGVRSLGRGFLLARVAVALLQRGRLLGDGYIDGEDLDA
jgi:hypothetical protein